MATQFAALRDEEFFSAKVQHLYMYDDVTAASVALLKQQIRAANQDLQGASSAEPETAAIRSAPRPIVIHLNSRGGSVYASLTMSSVFAESLLPICVMVDGISASAATMLSLLAPYRVMTPYATCLVHEWSLGSDDGDPMYAASKRSDWEFFMRHMGSLDARVDQLVLQRTRATRAQLEELMSRDKLLDATECLRLGFVDRVLSVVTKKTPSPPFGKNVVSSPEGTKRLLKMPDANHMYLTADPNAPSPSPASPSASSDPAASAPLAVQTLDRFLQSGGNAGATARPLVLHCSASGDRLHLNTHVYPMIARLGALRAPTVGVVDTIVDLYDFLPVLFCDHRVMYDNAQIHVHLMYNVERTWMLRDIVHNTAVLLESVRSILRTRTKLPAGVIRDLDSRRVALDAQQCLRFGLVDVVVSTIDAGSRPSKVNAIAKPAAAKPAAARKRTAAKKPKKPSA